MKKDISQLPIVQEQIKRAEGMISDMTGCRVSLVLHFPDELNNRKEVVMEAICDYFKITMEDLVSRSRKRDVVLARQVFVYLWYEPQTAGHTYKAIGRILNRDHGTIVHALQSIRNLLDIGDKMAIDTIRDIQDLLLSSRQ